MFLLCLCMLLRLCRSFFIGVVEESVRWDKRERNKMQKKENRKWILGGVALAAVVAVLAVVYGVFREKPVEGSKAIVIEVVDREEEKSEYRLKTDADYLRQAMEEADGLSFSGSESEYGMMVDTVNGVRADYDADGAYWSFSVNGEYCNYGIDAQPVEDGDVFSIVYTSAGQE